MTLDQTETIARLIELRWRVAQEGRLDDLAEDLTTLDSALTLLRQQAEQSDRWKEQLAAKACAQISAPSAGQSDTTAMQLDHASDFIRAMLEAVGLHGENRQLWPEGGWVSLEDLKLQVVGLIEDLKCQQAETPKATLTHELHDLITLMPDSQVDELLDYIRVLREARGLRASSRPPSVPSAGAGDNPPTPDPEVTPS